MPNAAGRVQAITDTVNRYVELAAKGSADDLVELYADDATVEDPVGGGAAGGEGASRAIRL
jgi:steroid Delta-isomerase